MFKLTDPGDPIRVGFVLVDGFSLVPFVAASEPLRMANRLLGRPVFEWGIYSASHRPVEAVNGMLVTPTGPLEEIRGCPNVIVAGGFERRIVTPAWLRRLLRTMDAAGATIGALGTGAFHLARAGLLDGRRATVHWEYAASFAEEFPAVRLTERLFEIDERRFTCSGGTAALDMMLHLISRQVSPDLATSVGDMFVHGRVRDARHVQKTMLPVAAARIPVEVSAAVSLMQRQDAARVRIADVAEEVGVSPRHLHRLFLQHLGKTPLRFANALRLQRARSYVLQSDLTIGEIAGLCGYAGVAAFSRAYRDAFGESPAAARAGDAGR